MLAVGMVHILPWANSLLHRIPWVASPFLHSIQARGAESL